MTNYLFKIENLLDFRLLIVVTLLHQTSDKKLL